MPILKLKYCHHLSFLLLSSHTRRCFERQRERWRSRGVRPGRVDDPGHGRNVPRFYGEVFEGVLSASWRMLFPVFVRVEARE